MTTWLSYLIAVGLLCYGLHTIRRCRKLKERRTILRARSVDESARWFLVILITLSLGFSASSARAEKSIGLALIAIRGPESVSTGTAINYYTKARTKMRVGLKVKVDLDRVIKMRENPFQRLMLLSSRRNLIKKAEQLALKAGYKAKLVLLSLPPFVEADGVWWLAGEANGECRLKGGVAWANAEKRNHLGLPRDKESVDAMAHEVGHLLGAHHLDNISIMNPGALAYSPLGLSFSWESRAHVEECFRMWRM